MDLQSSVGRMGCGIKMTFKKHNFNPKRKTTDCVIRAIVGATNKNWYDVFDKLVEIARSETATPTCKITYETYLADCETIPVMYIRYDGKKKRYTVKDVCNMTGRYIVQVAGHLTPVINGVCYDLYDCTDRSAYKIWRVI